MPEVVLRPTSSIVEEFRAYIVAGRYSYRELIAGRGAYSDHVESFAIFLGVPHLRTPGVRRRDPGRGARAGRGPPDRPCPSMEGRRMRLAVAAKASPSRHRI